MKTKHNFYRWNRFFAVVSVFFLLTVATVSWGQKYDSLSSIGYTLSMFTANAPHETPLFQPDGGCILNGLKANSNGAPGIGRINSSGQQVFFDTVFSHGRLSPYVIEPGHIYCTGFAGEYWAGFLAAINSSTGKISWRRVYDDGFFIYNFKQLANKNLLVIGTQYIWESSVYVAKAILLDSTGNYLFSGGQPKLNQSSWIFPPVATAEYHHQSVISDVIELPNKDLLFCLIRDTYTQSLSLYNQGVNNGNMVVIFRTDSVGTVLWHKEVSLPKKNAIINGPIVSSNCCIVENSDASFLIYDATGRALRNNYSPIIKINSNGDLLWLKYAKNTCEIKPDSSGRYVCMGIDSASSTSNQYTYKPFFLTLDSNGDTAIFDSISPYLATRPFSFEFNISARKIINAYSQSELRKYTFAKNWPPYFTSTSQTLLTETLEDQLYRDTVFAADSFPDEKIRYSLLTPIPATMKIDSISGIITYTPTTEADSGFHPVSILARDRIGQKDTLSINLHVTAVNDTPRIITLLPLKNAYYEGDTLRIVARVLDEENDPINYTWIFKNDTVTTARDTASYLLDYRSSGMIPVVLKARDSHGKVTMKTLQVTINNIVCPPKIANTASMLANNSILRAIWPNNFRDPDIDSSSMRFSFEISSAVPNTYKKFVLDTVKTDTVSIRRIMYPDSFAYNYIKIRTSAIDSFGNATGWGAYSYYSYLNNAQATSRSVSVSESTLMFSFDDSTNFVIHFLSGNWIGRQLRFDYFGTLKTSFFPLTEGVCFTMSGVDSVSADISIFSHHTSRSFTIVNERETSWKRERSFYNSDSSSLTFRDTLSGAYIAIDSTVFNPAVLTLQNEFVPPAMFSLKVHGQSLMLSVPYMQDGQPDIATIMVVAINGKKIRTEKIVLNPGYYTPPTLNNLPSGTFFVVFKSTRFNTMLRQIIIK